MPLVWLTGMPGAGKSAVATALRPRGVASYDADDDGFRKWRHIETAEIVDHPPDPLLEWQPDHQLILDPDRVAQLKAEAIDRIVVLAGHVPNEHECLHLFDVVVAIAVDDDTLHRRLRDRPGRSFGRTAEVREAILSWNRDAADHFERIGARVVDGTRPLNDVADAVLEAING